MSYNFGEKHIFMFGVIQRFKVLHGFIHVSNMLPICFLHVWPSARKPTGYISINNALNVAIASQS